MFPETTRQQIEELLLGEEFRPVQVDGLRLTATLRERGVVSVPSVAANGRTTWREEPAVEVVFDGGRWGPHVLRCSVSPPDRIRAHWRGYVDAHLQHAGRVGALRGTPAGAKYSPPAWQPSVGDRVSFTRGMFGRWPGVVERLYRAVGSRLPGRSPAGTRLADVRFTGRNGRSYVRERVPVSDLYPRGTAPVDVREAP